MAETGGVWATKTPNLETDTFATISKFRDQLANRLGTLGKERMELEHRLESINRDSTAIQDTLTGINTAMSVYGVDDPNPGDRGWIRETGSLRLRWGRSSCPFWG